jgi:hypothetical protein
MPHFPIRRVDRRQAAAPEVLGSKPKFWFRHEGAWLLFKADDRGTGEDWAEVIACHLCALLGLPHVDYELAAEYDDDQFLQPGVVCARMAPRADALVLGNQLLLATDPAYPNEQRFRVRQHTVDAVESILRRLEPPPALWCVSLPPRIESALDIFVGYIMLDAWIANQDRHHENWGALSDEILRLAPTFDHGAAMGRNLRDSERQERLTTRDVNRTVAAFASRARSAFYRLEESGRPLGTLETFQAFALKSPMAGQVWLERLSTVTANTVLDIIERVPTERMTPVGKEFTHQLLIENQRRLLDLGPV